LNHYNIQTEISTKFLSRHSPFFGGALTQCTSIPTTFPSIPYEQTASFHIYLYSYTHTVKVYLSILLKHSKANNEIDYYPYYAIPNISPKYSRSKTNKTNYSIQLKTESLLTRTNISSMNSNTNDHSIVSMRTTKISIF
jgi:hypothetical protein